MNLVVAGIALFGAGLTATLSPCVVPLLPGYLALLADGADDRRARVGRVVAFAAGAVLVFVALGAVVGAVGAVGTVGLDANRAARWVQRITGVAFVAGWYDALISRAGLIGTR